jgi:hypothetical protein
MTILSALLLTGCSRDNYIFTQPGTPSHLMVVKSFDAPAGTTAFETGPGQYQVISTPQPVPAGAYIVTGLPVTKPTTRP